MNDSGEPIDIGARNHNWRVIPPICNYLGLSYGDWASRWLNWLVGVDPDKNNNGPVVFLRGIDFEMRGGSYRQFVRIGNEKLRISLDQAIFWPIICLFVDEKMVPTFDTQQKRLTDIFSAAVLTDHPPLPSQATIEGDPIVSNLEGFFTVSPDFQLHVPEASYGPTLGSLFQIPIVYEGDWRAAICGYFILMKPLQDGGPYKFASNGNAEDRYHTETLVEIEVIDDSPQNRSLGQGAQMKEIIQEELSRQQVRSNGQGLRAQKDELFAPYRDIIDASHQSDTKQDKPSSKNTIRKQD